MGRWKGATCPTLKNRSSAIPFLTITIVGGLGSRCSAYGKRKSERSALPDPEQGGQDRLLRVVDSREAHVRGKRTSRLRRVVARHRVRSSEEHPRDSATENELLPPAASYARGTHWSDPCTVTTHVVFLSSGRPRGLYVPVLSTVPQFSSVRSTARRRQLRPQHKSLRHSLA